LNSALASRVEQPVLAQPFAEVVGLEAKRDDVTLRNLGRHTRTLSRPLIHPVGKALA
jgi:hypothetical protein